MHCQEPYFAGVRGKDSIQFDTNSRLSKEQVLNFHFFGPI